MRNGFTLAEVLITLTVIGIVCAVTIPMLNNAKPDRDKVIYKKAIYSIGEVMKKTIEDPTSKLSTKYWADENLSEDAFCEAFAKILNTSGKIMCNNTSSYNNPNIITTDGIKFWGLEGKVHSLEEGNKVKARTIYIERMLTSKEKNLLSKKRDSYHVDPGLKVQVLYNGRIRIPETDEWEYENTLANKI